MNAKSKALIVLFALLAFTTVSIASTQYFTDRTTALSALNNATPKTFTAGDCKIDSVTEVITLEGSQGILVGYSFDYTVDGFQEFEYNAIEVASVSQKEIETAVAKECDDRWALISAQAAADKVTAVQIDYTRGELNALLSRVYSVITKEWKGNE